MDREKGNVIKKLEDHGGTIRGICFTNDGSVMCSVSDDFHITLVDVKQQQKIISLVDH